MIRGSYICRDKGGCLYTVRRVFFRCLVYRDDNFTENPTEVAVALCFNGPVLCHRGKVFFFFFQKACHMWLRGGCQLVLAFFILHSVMQVFHGGQLTVNHLFSLFSE